MSSAMPELGSKISLISKADIRYEGRLFTVDPQECTIALASVRSFGTEDRETQFPVAPQNQVYDYILFRGSDIKDIRVVNNVQSMPNDPAIMQLSVPPTIGQAPQYPPQYQHPVVGSAQYPQYQPMGGLPGMRPVKQPSELELAPGPPHLHQPLHHHQPPLHHQPPPPQQVKDQGSMLDLIGGGGNQAQSNSRSTTPSALSRKSPTIDQGTQVGHGQGNRNRRDSGNQNQRFHNQQAPAQRNGPHSRNRNQPPQQLSGNHQQHGGQQQHGGNQQQHGGNQPPQHGNQPTQQGGNQSQPFGNHQQHGNQHPFHNQQYQQGYNNQGWRGRGAWRGRGRGSFPANRNQKTLKFDSEYDFDAANTEFEELRNKLARAKLDDAPPAVVNGDGGEKKDDSGNETGAEVAETEEDDGYMPYDKAKSFFDNISCEAVERQKGRSQRTDWRTERKLNSETFGVASARRGAWRGRGAWRQYPQHQPWRAGGRGGGGRGRGNNSSNNNRQNTQQPQAQPQQQPAK